MLALKLDVPLYVTSPKLSCRGEMIEGGQSQLLLAVAAESAMILPWLKDI